MTVVALIVIVFLIFLGLYVVIDLAVLPGKIAHSRGHPQADAVKMAGIIGMVSGILWPLALVWAYYHPAASAHETAELKARIAELEAQLAQGTASEAGKPA